MSRPLALVTGASTGLGYELAKGCARSGFDLTVAADKAEQFRAHNLKEARVDVFSARETAAF